MRDLKGMHMAVKVYLVLIWLVVGLFTAWKLNQPNFYWETFEELFWFGLTTSLIALSIPYLKNKLLLFGWGTYSIGLLLDIADDFISDSDFILLIFDTSLKNIGFLITCYGMLSMILTKREVINQLNTEIKQREKLEAQLRYEANHDPLTGIGNRKACFETFNELSDKQPLLFYFDLDDFKQANDKYGHHVGDNILRAFSASLTKQFGDDYCFRIGGDEFVAFGGDNDQALSTLRDCLLEQIFEYGVGLSIGTAKTDSKEQPDTIVQRADSSMYSDKDSKVVRTRPRHQ
ncbi:GGDEF domain-containing protein [Pseudoalteromonas aurantia]|uniref:diguanylate cyclase n=2 Tax=Pseudoalteromonas aurantia TaxID=43654 RepID=A0A5S3V686_9GAMM|nr:GGDEF domain-containing protein [Pseudoalteromonas aurantia]TMO67040.1 GGDEF domain-containing protein [Pseudoalteromonas aurantia]TMO72359.1 GGDEF domain-containing protein [Pseudoalteromonas aurantia]